MNTVADKLAALRQEMQNAGIVAYIVPSTDPHNSEYMAAHWMEMSWLTGFKGETGTALVTLDRAFLWTDSRYYLQAEKELAGTGVELMRESEIDTPTISQWLAEQYSNVKVGVNPEMFTVAGYRSLAGELSEVGIELLSINLIAGLWTINRPAIPQSELYEYDVKFAGESLKSKLERVRKEILQKRADTMIISALDEIAWLLNIRGLDVDFNPVVISYVLLEQDRCRLFVDATKLTDASRKYLETNAVEVLPYEKIISAIGELSSGSKVLFDGNRLNEALYEAIPVQCKKIDTQSPIMILKSMKNPVELEGERAAMRKDAVALTKFFKWLEEECFVQNEVVTEFDLMNKLHEFRQMGENFVIESFGTIAGYQSNGAIVHYEAKADDCAVVKPTGMLLLDSGGQYLEGTTDITRTICFDEPTAEMKRDYTLVLKGHIALANAVFPRGTRGNQLDVLAHQFMWKEGINYGHGTGHGVGHFLGCHEGPQNIRTDNNPSPLRVGNICSDEPGIYRAGKWGVRIENLVAVEPFVNTEFGEYLHFETLTLCYYDTHLIEMSMLTTEEKQWLNSYHERVVKEISPLLNTEEAEWLKQKCKAI